MKQYNYFHAATLASPVEGGLLLKGAEHTVEVVFVAPGTLRVDYNPRHHDDLSWAVIAEPNFSLGVSSISPQGVSLSDGYWRVEVQESPFALNFFDGEGNLFCSTVEGETVGQSGQAVVAKMTMREGDHYYGLGEKMGHMDKCGKAMTMWNTDVVPHLPNTDPLYVSIPFFIGFNNNVAWGVFLDNTYRSHFDMGKHDPGTIIFGADGGRLRYYLLAGPRIQDVLGRYTELTGKMPMPPKWSLGYQQCRYSYHPDSQVIEIARTMREKEIPCDALYLDIHYMDGYRVFTFDSHEFADPEGLTDQLKSMGYKTVCLVDPGVKVDDKYSVYREGIEGEHFVRHADGSVYVGDVWPGATAFPDFIKEKTRHWWGEWHRFYIERGIDGIWNDMNEPAVFNVAGKTMPEQVRHGEDGCFAHARVHNVYGLEMAKATRAGLLRLKPEERPFVLTRAGFAGIQRYSAVWFGDNSSWWEHLAAVIPMSIGMGLSGVPFIGTDIGGFVDDCEPELLARWTQLGALAPFCRNHSAIDTIHQEPWAFGPVIEEICRTYIRLRYQLMPFLYTLFFEASSTGLPIWRPLVLHYPQDKNTWRLDDQCLLGNSLLIAPVTAIGKDKRMVYLPEGSWVDWWTREKYSGNGYIVADASLAVMPLFVKAGAMIPQAPVVNYHGEKPEDAITIDVFADHTTPCAGMLYHDDGTSLAYTCGQYNLWQFALDFEPTQAYFRVLESGQSSNPYQDITFNFIGMPRPLAVTAVTQEGLEWTYNDGTLTVKTANFADFTITWE
ncbi:MAG: alpha-glucosidase [Peptococcaceae bacterium]|nr:alpha-glucosidase [Peptococcaceae bacterium]